jgi:hypothetical protein
MRIPQKTWPYRIGRLNPKANGPGVEPGDAVGCGWGKWERDAVRVPQLAGFAVTIAVVAIVDLPIDWLVFAAMLCGGLATFAISCAIRLRG